MHEIATISRIDKIKELYRIPKPLWKQKCFLDRTSCSCFILFLSSSLSNMVLSASVIACTLTLASVAIGEQDKGQDNKISQLFGTWSSKSNTVFTGPGFFNPSAELLIEPSLPGISYSFDKNGNWEQAIYQVAGNPRNHSCPTAHLIWQHGKYEYNPKKGSITLRPYKVDGRQLFSDPCNDGGESTYMRYHQVEEISHFDVDVDSYYHGKLKLQLYNYDGTKKQPMWLTYRPPMMLPTRVLNPTTEKQAKDSNSDLMKSKRENKNLEDYSFLQNNYIVVSKASFWLYQT